MTWSNRPSRSPKSAIIVGAGGNIGSNLVQQVARMPEIASVTLIDWDVYEKKNLEAQIIDVADIGRPKAVAQAAKLRRIRRDLCICAIAAPVESVPLGRLRAEVLLACLDSRRARQEVNRIALRLGLPWIDAGVDGDGLLARVSSFRPGPDHPCLECTFGDRDYQIVDQVYSCLGERLSAPPTRSPACLGALAASIQAIECRKLLSGGANGPAFDHQILIDAAHHRIYRTRLTANPDCRLLDHAAWRIEPIRRSPADITLSAALALGHRANGGRGRTTLRVEGSPFVARLVCPRCGCERSLLRHRASLGARSARCRGCRAGMVVPGFDLRERLDQEALSDRTKRRSLRSLGLRVGDVFSVRGPTWERHYELVG